MTKNEKPWGYEEILFNTEIKLKTGYVPVVVKKITIDGEEMTSFHFHKNTNEILRVEKGMAEIRLENDVISLNEGQVFLIESNTSHQIQNIDSKILEIVETSFPFEPKDEVRVEDPYEGQR